VKIFFFYLFVPKKNNRILLDSIKNHILKENIYIELHRVISPYNFMYIYLKFQSFAKKIE